MLGSSTKLPWPDRRDGDSGDETYGVVDLDGEWLREVSREKFEPLEGDRDNERRSCRIAELASTW